MQWARQACSLGVRAPPIRRRRRVLRRWGAWWCPCAAWPRSTSPGAAPQICRSRFGGCWKLAWQPCALSWSARPARLGCSSWCRWEHDHSVVLAYHTAVQIAQHGLGEAEGDDLHVLHAPFTTVDWAGQGVCIHASRLAAALKRWVAGCHRQCANAPMVHRGGVAAIFCCVRCRRATWRSCGWNQHNATHPGTADSQKTP